MAEGLPVSVNVMGMDAASPLLAPSMGLTAKLRPVKLDAPDNTPTMLGDDVVMLQVMLATPCDTRPIAA